MDNYLTKRLKGVPKSHIYRILRSGEVRVNSRRVGPDYRVQAGDRLRLPPVRTARPAAAPQQPPASRLKADVIYEDDVLLVINKPAGVAVHGGSGISFGVIEQLRAERPEGAVPRTGAPARPRNLGRAAAGQAALRAARAAPAAARGRGAEALPRAGERALARRQAQRQAAAAQVRAGLGRAARRCQERGHARAYRVPAAAQLERATACSKRSSRPGAPTRSACISPISAFRSPATTSTAISRSTSSSRSRG